MTKLKISMTYGLHLLMEHRCRFSATSVSDLIDGIDKEFGIKNVKIVYDKNEVYSV